MTIRQHQELGVEERKERFSDAKRRLLQQRMRGRASHVGIDQIHPRPLDAKIPLSAEQRRVWLHASQQPDLPIYNEPFTIHRKGSLDLGILEASFSEVLQRHEAWRTSFSPEGEQVIHDAVRVTLPLLDLSGLPWAEREAEALRIATEDARNPISIHAVPLFRARVVRMKEDEHRLYLTFHHIIFDGVSISRIFVPELSAIYASFEQGKPSPLPSPELQYGDYAIWRERHVDSPSVKQHLAYWLEHLSGELPVLRLPEDRPRSAIASHRGSMECFKIPEELLDNLRGLSRVQGVTLYMTLLAAFKVLLFRYSGQNDLIVGSASDARRRPELEPVMGYFLDTFAIRTRPVADLRFWEYLDQTRDGVLGALAAADVPFDRVVHEINPKRDTSLHPIFQVFFSIRPPMPPRPEGWDLTQMDVIVGTSKFVLHLELAERTDHMEARFLYCTDIWDASTIKRMAAHWLVLLRSICQNPKSSLGDLAILTLEETAALRGAGGWDDSTRAFPQVPLNTLIEEQVLRTPYAIAATFANERWTYGELNTRADVFASRLRAAGVTRDSIVAIAIDRSLDLLAGLIAILKTGAAYLPIDIRMPREGIELCLADARPSAILTQRVLKQRVASSVSTIVLVDENCEHEDLIVQPPQSANNLESTAYLIYTSGTTGKPKGVEVSHRSLVNLLASMQTAPGFGPNDVLLAITPISFDISALELFLPLISGGVVAIASREEVQDPHLLASAIKRSGCSVMQATPATWRTLLQSGWRNARPSPTKNSPRTLRALCGGEALPRELANRLLATGVELWNMYGPTETTIWSLIHRVQHGRSKEAGLVSVGLPIGNTKAYILDERLQPLPTGVPGELFLSGVGLAKGYRGQPQQTEDRFIKVASVGGARLYRTGDVAVRKTDGTIEVQGRTDNQVKVRGHRIELEAIESAVLRHPHVADAVARAWPETTGEFRLSVYVVTTEGFTPSRAGMRAFLKSSLPENMIPSDVIRLNEIPLTPHGKVDRSRLPAPSNNATPDAQTAVKSPEEARLAAIWSDLLECKYVGLDDNFFDLGGHSLLIAALQLRIATEFDHRISIAELFQCPTVRQQAQIMQDKSKSEPVLPPGILALHPFGARNQIFWVRSPGVDLAKVIGEDQQLFSVALSAEDVPPLGEKPTLQSICTCMLQKILATRPKGPYVLGGFCVGGILAYEIASQMRAAGHEVSLLALVDAPNPARLESRDSLMRKINYLRYIVKRAARLGSRKSLEYFREHLLKLFARTVQTKPVKVETRVAQEILEAAALAYQPKRYEGKVLLILASDHPPHKDLLPGWQVVVPAGLHTRYVNAHHRDLLKGESVRSVAEAIVSHLKCRDELALTDQRT
jgi:amino acid adenylation domain-containing protein